jgi:hypothetical protein
MEAVATGNYRLFYFLAFNLHEADLELSASLTFRAGGVSDRFYGLRLGYHIPRGRVFVQFVNLAADISCR